MTINVPSQLVALSEVSGKTGAVGSASSLISPYLNNINFMLGCRMNDLLHYQQFPDLRQGTGRFRCYRHVNCDNLFAFFSLTYLSSTPYITLQAGAGSAANVYFNSIYADLFRLFAWDSGDYGICDVTYTTTNCYISAIAVWAAKRPTMEATTDTCIEPWQSGIVRAGLQPGDYICYSDQYDGLSGLVNRIDSIKSSHKRQVWSHSDVTDAGETTCTSATWQTIHTLKHKAKRYESATSYGTYTTNMYCWMTGSGTYQVRVRSGLNTITSGTLSNTSGAWTTLTGLHIDATAVDTIYIEAIQASGSPTIVLHSSSITEA